MDYQTGRYYEHQVEELLARYDAIGSPLAEHFASSFPAGGRIMDVGCGSGRDLRALLAAGFDAVGIEPSAALRQAFAERYPDLATRIQTGVLPGLQADERFDGILCSAVLMHIPSGDLLESLINLRDLLRPGGRLLMSVPSERDDLDAQRRDPHGRLFEALPIDQLLLLLRQLGFSVISQQEMRDSLGRNGVRWSLLLCEKQEEGGRSLDRIEAVLKRDRKVATYKLALLRAFCDIAARDRKAVDWLPGGVVSLSLQPLAECWLAYYWPLIAAPVRIPQSQTDQGESRPIAFRAELAELIRMSCQYYAVEASVAYSLMRMDYQRQKLPAELLHQRTRTLGVIRRVVLEGPVRHAAQGDMFEWDKTSQKVLVDAALWQEFCLSGYWIRDSLLLRWAGLCESFSKDSHCPRGLVLPYLLQEEDIQREQGVARSLYAQASQLVCVWSGQTIPFAEMAVDHVLPFALWRNNDLWNLLPAARQVNSRKRDRVPEPSLLRNRRDAIIHNWEFVHACEPELFGSEAGRSLGHFDPQNWQAPLFEHLASKAAQAIYCRGESPWAGV